MPTVAAARGFSPTDRTRRPVGVRNRKIDITGTRISATQTSRLSFSSAGPKNGIQSIGSVMSGTSGTPSGVPSSP